MVDHLASQGTPPTTLFDEASTLVRWHYLWMMLHDWVERITETGIVAREYLSEMARRGNR